MARPEPKFSMFRWKANAYTRDAAQIHDEYGRKVATIYRVRDIDPLDLAKKICDTVWMPVTDKTRDKAEQLADVDVVAVAANADVELVEGIELDTDAGEEPEVVVVEPPVKSRGKSKKVPKWVQDATREAASQIGRA